MQEEELDIEALKKNEEFLGNLKDIAKEMREENSIAKGYQLLDAKLLLEASEEEINEIFSFIVNTAFDVLAEKLSTGGKFDMDDYEDLATARAIYENGIQRYSENEKKASKELFLILYFTIKDGTLAESMLIHAAVAMAGVSFDDFIEKMVDVSGVDESDPTAFFIQTYVDPIDTLLKTYEKEITKAKAEIKALEASM
ncbi:MAG: Unknown protein [uncultured Sulfurovum sp.]|uniref:Uncharacterized protein n=1 Tax=uncultured Sulfurovum sp. TaxID=269237 RepID=A0A6S6SMW4_9BACT|nr:MAG: Unknown protein [uncultured Sulfurovum sp.]